ncbi:MAG TPA: SDR family NAD(P)-dependent oxidoreductase [Methylomirabilota bacterium]|nr:SDR family NAD(P)-dependent oxidoreductase [Methylomirabilota bacterium]
MELAGKRALLTGATGGLGRAIAGALADRGTTLVLSARNEDALRELAESLPGEHRVAPADLAEEGAAVLLAEDAGEVDCLVANAGLPGTGTIESYSPEELTRALRVNLEAPMMLARELAPGMSERGEGHLVFVASLAGKSPSPRTAIYCGTKFGLRGFALSLRADLARSGVGVSLVVPGFIREAGMFADSGARPPPGLGTATPEQVAAAVVRAIERDKMEVAVAPLRQRALAHLGLASPRVALRAVTGRTARQAANRVAEGQANKR